MNESGKIVLDGDIIRYCSSTYGNWDVSVADVKIIGEATNQNGPFADDYFFCFATASAGWVEASFYADGRDKFLHALGTRLGTQLQASLCDSADLASRVLWPPSLVGEQMFKYDDAPPKGLFGKLFGPTRNLQTYTDRVVEVLTGLG